MMQTTRVAADEEAKDHEARLWNTLKVVSLALPMPTRTKMRIYYDVFTEFFEIVTARSGILNYGQEGLCRKTIASLPREGRWLDVGCGVGGPACLLAGENPGVDITGINIASAQIAKANERAASRGLSKRVRFGDGDACAMPFEGSPGFDGLYAIETAFHFPDKEAFAHEAKRVLRPGGRFACADLVLEHFTDDPLKRLRARAYHAWLGLMNVQSMYSGEKWRHALVAAGFSDIGVEDVTSFALRDGIALFNRQLTARRHELERKYQPLLIDSVLKVNERVISKIEEQPMRYVLVTARA